MADVTDTFFLYYVVLSPFLRLSMPHEKS